MRWPITALPRFTRKSRRMTSRSLTTKKRLQFDKDLTEIYVPLGILYYQAE